MCVLCTERLEHELDTDGGCRFVFCMCIWLVCAKSCFSARTVSRRKSRQRCAAERPKYITMFNGPELMLCLVLLLLTSDVKVAVEPVMLEGSVVQRDISMLSRKTERGVRLSGFTIELAFDQPLVVHAGNKSAPLRTVKPLSPIDRAFLDLVSMRCNGQAEPIRLGQFSARGTQFLNLLGTGGGDEIAIANITTSPKHLRQFLKHIDPMESSDASNMLYFWFSDPAVPSQRDLERCKIVMDEKQQSFVGNFHGQSLNVSEIKLVPLAGISFSTDNVETIFYEDVEEKHPKPSSSHHVHGCVDKSFATALSELDSGSTTRTMAKIMGGLVKTVVEGATEKIMDRQGKLPMLHQAEIRVGANLKDDLAGKMETNTNSETPNQVAEMLDAALCYNLTGLITDSVTAAVAPRLSYELFTNVAFTTKTVALEQVSVKAASLITEVVRTTMAARLNQILPRLMHQALLPRLYNTLTRSVTHAVVPTVSRSVSHTDHQSRFCFECFKNKKYCNFCHYSPSNAYYNLYYSAYYTDFYSDYYGKYYGVALAKTRDEYCRNNKCHTPTYKKD